jgi:hypothetical protein
MSKSFSGLAPVVVAAVAAAEMDIQALQQAEDLAVLVVAVAVDLPLFIPM